MRLGSIGAYLGVRVGNGSNSNISVHSEVEMLLLHDDILVFRIVAPYSMNCNNPGHPK